MDQTSPLQAERERLRTRGDMKKTILYGLILAISILVPRAWAEEPAKEGAALESEEMIMEGDHDEYVFPSLMPELSLFGGYRYVHSNGSDRVDEYEYLHNSWPLGGELRAFKFPHRFHLELDIKNRKDFFGDVGYAYEDIVVFRGVTRSLFHNLDNILLIDLDPATPTPGVDVRDGGEKYGLQAVISNASLRLKAPAYPLHLYFEGMQVSRDGDQQQRDLIGAAYFNNVVRTSQKRDIDTKATTQTVGTNGHFGPIEVDYAHSEKRFTVDGDDVMNDLYAPAGFGPPIPPPLGSTRNGGIYPHDLVPQLKSSTDTVKIHTSYTGALVAAATFSKTKKENRDSGAEADNFLGSGEVSWIASRDLSFFFKYRQAETRVDNPDNVEFADVCNPSLNATGTYQCTILEAISKIVRTASVLARYRLTSGIVLKGEYTHETIKRSAADQWFIPLSSQINTVSLSSDIRLSKQLKANMKFIHKSVQNPAINIDPHQANEGHISVTWSPASWITALASYRLASERRHSLQFIDITGAEPVPVDSPDNRNDRRERFLGSVSLFPVKNLTATLSFFYLHDKQKEDLAYDDSAPQLLFDSGVTNQSTVRNVSVDLQYLLSKRVTLNVGVSNTDSKGKFHPSDPNLMVPVSIASFSELEMRETIYSVGGEFDLKKGFMLGTHYKYARLKDLADNPYDDIENGEAHIFILSLIKRW